MLWFPGLFRSAFYLAGRPSEKTLNQLKIVNRVGDAYIFTREKMFLEGLCHASFSNSVTHRALFLKSKFRVHSFGTVLAIPIPV